MACGFSSIKIYYSDFSEFILPFLLPYTGTIPNQKLAYIFPILYILGIIFHKSLKNFPKCKGKGSFPNSKIKSLHYLRSLISRINEVYVFSIKYRYCDILLKKHKLHLSRLFCCNHTYYCFNMVNVTNVTLYNVSVRLYNVSVTLSPALSK